jgi:hypothetical protein
VYVRHRTLNTAAAPPSVHFIPEPQCRCLTITLYGTRKIYALR